MIQRIAFFSVLLLISTNLFGQSILKGVVKDRISGEGLAYVNIGIIDKNRGTVTDINGNFQLSIDKKYNNDELKISMIGYKSKSFKVEEFIEIMQNTPEIKLDQETYELTTVTIHGEKIKKQKEKVLGNLNSSPNNTTGFETNLLGYEKGIIIKIKRRSTFIKDFSINIAQNKYDTFKFRINVYDLKDNLPNRNILKENIIVSSSIKEGKLTIDLSKYNIVVEDDFFISMEWIEDMGDFGLFFSTDITGSASPTIVRTTSQGNWIEVGKKAFGVGIGIAVTVLY